MPLSGSEPEQPASGSGLWSGHRAASYSSPANGGLFFSRSVCLMGSSAALMSMRQRNGCVDLIDRGAGKDPHISGCKTL